MHLLGRPVAAKIPDLHLEKIVESQIGLIMDEEEEGQDEGTTKDASIGSLGVRNFLASRIQEINSLSHQISTTGIPSSKGLAFQHVPKHMRRRAVSHNPKRLPKRLQQTHLSQVEKSSGAVAKKPKRPSRKYRRRPSNLVQEYNRRQRNHKWLETHIWHAKRFFIANKWGYRIPMSPTDKGYRAAYRGARKYCVLRDISFCSCLRLTGSFEVIAEKMSTSFLPSQANSVRIDSETYKNGMREGILHFYEASRYPFGYVGKVRFLWKTDQSALLLWVHPAQKEDIISQLCDAFEMVSTRNLKFSGSETCDDDKVDEESMDVVDSHSDADVGSQPQDARLQGRFDLRRHWINYSTNVQMHDLEGCLNRFRLYGPLSTSTLQSVLDVSPSCQLQQLSGDRTTQSFWWTDYYKNRGAILENQRKVWDKLICPSQVPAQCVIPLTVRDPRINIPQSHELPVSSSVTEEISDLSSAIAELQQSSGSSPLWDDNLRLRVISEKMTQQEFDKRRSKLLIPGTMLNLGVEENQIPILLIYRPRSAAFGLDDSGWDMILPAGWAMPFLIALVYRSVRTIGLRDASHFEFEAGSSICSQEEGCFPPDSACGEQESTSEAETMKTTHFGFPPAKRPNFIKLKCPFPFAIDWKTLLKTFADNETDIHSFFVLRDFVVLQQIKQWLLNSKNFDAKLLTISNKESCLVKVRLTVLGKGSFGANSVICIPTETDVNELRRSKIVEEPPTDDTENRRKREILKQQRDKVKKFQQKKRRQLRKKLKKPNDLNADETESNSYSTDNLDFFNTAINCLWLPDSEIVLQNITRKTFGIIVFGHETYSVGKCTGVGYCALKGLELWLNTCASADWNSKRFVLVRDCKDSLVYRLAKLDICL